MSRWVTGIAIGLSAGMLLSAWAGTEARVLALLGLVVAIIIASLFPSRERIMLGIISALAFGAGMFLYTQAFTRWYVLPETVAFMGPVEIIERGEAKVFYRPMTLRPIDVIWSGGDILYRSPTDVVGMPGEQWDFQCAVSRPENFEPGFDYRLLLATRGVGYVCEHGGQSRLSPSEGVSLRQRLASIQSGLQARIKALIPEPEAGLLSGLLIGGSDTLAPETKAAFARAGLSHIVAVSGYNMSVVAEGLVILSLVLGLWRRLAVGLAVIGLALFLLIIDGSAASLRAALMAWLAFGAYFVGRPAASWNGLLLAGVVMLCFNPLLIRFDVGFQLSFLATLALLVFARHFETFAFFRRWYGKLSALFLTTIVIELFTLPIIISAFGTVSLVAPFANALVLPLVPIAMFVGMAAIGLAALVPSLGFLLMPLVWLPLALIIRLAEGLAVVPWANLSGLDMTPSFAVLWYVGLGLAVYGLERIRKRYVLGMDH
ncbi:MAG: ComEC/Rec2 family competence protein [Candidatus Moraniibacteriota bacterium]|nr:MAG: ComEC/Rec2 family competence protein [Candidatus Moranbacteria bacterium]